MKTFRKEVAVLSPFSCLFINERAIFFLMMFEYLSFFDLESFCFFIEVLKQT